MEFARRNVELSRIPPALLEKLRWASKIALQAIHDLQNSGNRFLAGSDGLTPGFSLHDELEWFTRAGFTPLEALQTAIINPETVVASHLRPRMGASSTGSSVR